SRSSCQTTKKSVLLAAIAGTNCGRLAFDTMISAPLLASAGLVVRRCAWTSKLVVARLRLSCQTTRHPPGLHTRFESSWLPPWLEIEPPPRCGVTPSVRVSSTPRAVLTRAPNRLMPLLLLVHATTKLVPSNAAADEVWLPAPAEIVNAAPLVTPAVVTK